MKVKDLILQIVSTCFFVDPSENEIMVSMYERNNDGDVIDIIVYPISRVRGADGYNRICVEKSCRVK